MIKIMRKRLTMVMMLCAAMCSCNKSSGEEGPKDAVTVKLTASLNSYFGAGKTVSPIWTAADRLVVTDIANGASAESKASMTGNASSMFSVSLNGLKNGDELVAVLKGSATVKDGKLCFSIPTEQNGTDITPALAGKFKYDSHKISGADVALSSTGSVLVANVQQAGYMVTDIVLEAVGGEKIAGNVAVDVKNWTYSATDSKITVHVRDNNPEKGSLSIPILLTPCTLSKGYKLVFKTDKRGDFEFTSNENIEFRPGAYVESGEAKEDKVRKLLACGSNKVYLFNKDKVEWGQRYTNGLIWSWDCTSIQGTVAGAKSSSHIDDTKIVNNKRQLLVTCSNNNGWCVLLEPDYEKNGYAKLLFWTNVASNAHSAEYLPGNYVVVACSVDGGDCLQLYSVNKNNVPLKTYPLQSAHGAVWNDTVKRLYAIGGTSLQIYKWDETKGELELEKTVQTTPYVDGLHDISLVDANTLILGGHKCALYNVTSSTFTAVNHFNDSGRNGIKSLNYNAVTGECFYTFAVAATHEGSYDWSSHKVRYTDKINGTGIEKYLLVDDINMYKVRVFNW